MDFALSFEQQALIDSLEEFCKRELYPHENLVEELRYVPEEIKKEIQQKSIEAGFAGMNLPVEWGGQVSTSRLKCRLSVCLVNRVPR